jgi:signal transduction histidine kinase/DNA-binding response OmpR family regulator
MNALSAYRALVFGLLLIALSFEGYSLSPEQGKSAFLYNFIKYTTWPNESDLNEFSVGLYGKDSELLTELRRIEKILKVRDKSISVRQIQNLDDAKQVQLLIITHEFNPKFEYIANYLRRSSTLLVTEGSDDKRNVMINFTQPSDDRLAFEVNRASIVYEGLKLNKELLIYGGTELDVATIYKETEAELSLLSSTVQDLRSELKQQERFITQQRDLLTQQDKEIKEKELRIENQSEKIKSQSSKIIQQSEAINEKSARLETLEKDLSQITTALKSSEDWLKKNEGLLQIKESVLAKKEADINRYSSQIESNLALLSAQQQEIIRREELIKATTAALSEQGDIIQSQRYFLAVALTALILGTVLIVSTYRNARAKQQANEELELLSQAKSQFLSTMSHEIRTPMNGVLGLVELLRETRLSPQQRQYLEAIHISGEALINVINDILDYSKIEAGKMSIENIEYDLEKLLYESAAIFANKDTKSRAFYVDLPPSVPRCLVGDPTRIRQVVLNLLSNAFKFTEHGEVKLEAIVMETKEGEKELRISVSDTGVGLSEKQCASIFESFRQADTSTTRRFGGTGLGLSISSRLAQLMSGRIGVQSELGKGSTFWLSETLVEGQTLLRVNHELNDQSLLIVEPDARQCSTLAQHALSWGMHVTRASDRAQVERLLAKQIPAAMLISHPLSERSGVDLAAKIADRYPSINIILLCAATTHVSEDEIVHGSITASLTKPLTPQLFFDILGTQAQKEIQEEITELVDQPRFSGKKVLVAEDNQVNQMVIEGLLRMEGIDIMVANNGREAVELYVKQNNQNLQSTPFDLILMDCEMPELDGYSATREIRGLESKDPEKHVAIVALTAHAMAEHREHALKAGMDDHLSKPLKRQELEDILKRYCA